MIAKIPAVIVAASLSACSTIAVAEETVLDVITVTGVSAIEVPVGAVQLEKHTLSARRTNTSDTARLLEDIPGVSSYGAGGISSLPVIRGLADDRLRTTVDGMDLMTACPNHMNPALSFIDPTKVASVLVFAGITPVSVGGDSIGGTIQVSSAQPEFAVAGEGLLAEGELGMFHRSNGNTRGKNGRIMLASEWLNLSYAQSESDSYNYWAAGEFKVSTPSDWKNSSAGREVAEREVSASEYRGAANREFSLALRPFRNHVLRFSISEQNLDYEGFPNQRMDMIFSEPSPDDPLSYILNKNKPANVNRLRNLHYNGQYEWGEVVARLFHQNLRHHMDMLPERNGTVIFGEMIPMMMPMDTIATTDGGLLMASIDLSDTDILRIGYDFQKYRLDDWWPAIDNGGMGPNPFWNIRDGKRDRAYLFAEWEARLNPAWMTLLGIRGGTVKSNTGLADG